MTRLERLRREGKEAATWRGHKMLSRFRRYATHLYAVCLCGRSVYIPYRPAPNEADLMGEALAVNCDAMPMNGGNK